MCGESATVNSQNIGWEPEITQWLPDLAHCAIDAVGRAETRTTTLNLVRRGGRVLWIGLPENGTVIQSNTLIRNETSLIGSFSYADEDFLEAVKMMDAIGIPHVAAWLDIRPMAKGGDAFKELMVGSTPYAKILLDPLMK